MNTAYVAIGGNLIAEGYNSLEEVMADALDEIGKQDITILQVSQWFETAPVPVSDQPWFLNAVLKVQTALPASDLLAKLHHIEANFGRVRSVRNEARILDLDLIDYAGQVIDDESITLPHPRMHLRAFVLLPIKDLSDEWSHPVSGKSVGELIAEMPAGQDIRPKS